MPCNIDIIEFRAHLSRSTAYSPAGRCHNCNYQPRVINMRPCTGQHWGLHGWNCKNIALFPQQNTEGFYYTSCSLPHPFILNKSGRGVKRSKGPPEIKDEPLARSHVEIDCCRHLLALWSLSSRHTDENLCLVLAIETYPPANCICLLFTSPQEATFINFNLPPYHAIAIQVPPFFNQPKILLIDSGRLQMRAKVVWRITVKISPVYHLFHCWQQR